MRLWLFGDTNQSYEYISDKGLLQLVFASVGVGVCGMRGFEACDLPSGHSSAGISWLDHAVSLCTGELTGFSKFAESQTDFSVLFLSTQTARKHAALQGIASTNCVLKKCVCVYKYIHTYIHTHMLTHTHTHT